MSAQSPANASVARVLTFLVWCETRDMATPVPITQRCNARPGGTGAVPTRAQHLTPAGWTGSRTATEPHQISFVDNSHMCHVRGLLSIVRHYVRIVIAQVFDIRTFGERVEA